ncbi:MAG TPA: DUF2970 domain-containing protein [Methylophilaceae bacterium]|jgi:hypothetical protein
MSESEEKGLNPLRAARAVFWSFFGVRRNKDYADDVAKLSVMQIVVTGIIGGILFVLSLVMLVNFVIR